MNSDRYTYMYYSNCPTSVEYIAKLATIVVNSGY